MMIIWFGFFKVSWLTSLLFLSSYLLKGAQVDIRDSEEGTALMNASWNGRADIVRLLLNAGWNKI